MGGPDVHLRELFRPELRGVCDVELPTSSTLPIFPIELESCRSMAKKIGPHFPVGMPSSLGKVLDATRKLFGQWVITSLTSTAPQTVAWGRTPQGSKWW